MIHISSFLKNPEKAEFFRKLLDILSVLSVISALVTLLLDTFGRCLFPVRKDRYLLVKSAVLHCAFKRESGDHCMKSRSSTRYCRSRIYDVCHCCTMGRHPSCLR